MIARVQKAPTCSVECVTRRIVQPFARSSRSLSKQRSWKRASPTESASSTMSTSGSAASAVAKVSRACMPEE